MRIGGMLRKYNPKRYWRIRNYVTSPGGFAPFKVMGLFYLRRCGEIYSEKVKL